jgi:hypothetical protein
MRCLYEWSKWMSSICRNLTPWRWLAEAETYVGAFDLLVRIQCICWFLSRCTVNITWKSFGESYSLCLQGRRVLCVGTAVRTLNLTPRDEVCFSEVAVFALTSVLRPAQMLTLYAEVFFLLECGAVSLGLVSDVSIERSGLIAKGPNVRFITSSVLKLIPFGWGRS